MTRAKKNYNKINIEELIAKALYQAYLTEITNFKNSKK